MPVIGIGLSLIRAATPQELSWLDAREGPAEVDEDRPRGPRKVNYLGPRAPMITDDEAASEAPGQDHPERLLIGTQVEHSREVSFGKEDRDQTTPPTMEAPQTSAFLEVADDEITFKRPKMGEGPHVGVDGEW